MLEVYWSICAIAYWPSLLSGLPTRGRKSLAIWVAMSPAAPTRTGIASDSRVGTKFLAYGRRLKSPSASTRRDLRIASPTRPYIYVFFEFPKSQPAGRNRRNRAAKAAANRKIAGHKATKLPFHFRPSSPNHFHNATLHP